VNTLETIAALELALADTDLALRLARQVDDYTPNPPATGLTIDAWDYLTDAIQSLRNASFDLTDAIAAHRRQAKIAPELAG
jgi:hypothetical protein